MSERVVKIDIGVCTPSFPCKHRIVIHYNDSTQKDIVLSANDIIDDYWDVLTDEQRRHFEYLIN